MDDKNLHTLNFPYCTQVFWLNCRACGQNDNPDRVELQAANGQWPKLDFALPRQRHELDRVVQLMQTAYEKGKADNRKAVGALFKEPISL